MTLGLALEEMEKGCICESCEKEMCAVYVIKDALRSMATDYGKCLACKHGRDWKSSRCKSCKHMYQSKWEQKENNNAEMC